ncbi:MAG: putative Fe-S cluster assembly protein SufT [Pseudomonadales bacterium]|nr:putative Fe-S cluster assembly protein SufT [Pseudomonadales bacterium]
MRRKFHRGLSRKAQSHSHEVIERMQEREVVLTKREVEARLVPAGTEIMVPADTFVTITQSLGGSFTVAVNGNLARIEGHDADALGKKPLESSYETPEDGSVNENQVWEALRNCYDPEIPVNVVELGLIYECNVINGALNGDPEGNQVHIKMTLTAAGCGMGPVITDDVQRKVEHVPNVDKVTVELTFDPPWNNDMLSDEAKLELGML